ncbi:MAG: MAPEG family protein [Pseudomonadota bacterium]|nr:MAPEG family protein [Pseudomonadota bacterium]
MTHSPLLGPVVTLVAWTLVMLAWMAVTRFTAAKKAGINLGQSRGGRGQNLDGVVADRTQWKAHNYNHLMEQPTIFYAIVLALILMGMDVAINVWLAWGYVALRIVHSIVQATVNIVKYRFALFALSTFCLLGLTVHAAAGLIHG